MSAWPVKKTGQLARHNEGAVSIQLQARMQLQPSEVYTCHLIDNGKPAPQLRAVRTLNVYASDDEELDLNLVKHQ